MIYVTVFSAINVLLIWLMPKRLTRQEIYCTWGILAAVAINTDIFLGHIIDLYDFEQPGVQWYDLLVNAIMPPSFGVIFLNFLPPIKRAFYIIVWVCLSVLVEWGAVLSGFERLKEWNLAYSAVVYLGIFLFLCWHLRFLRSRV
jgi:hypothetical protein